MIPVFVRHQNQDKPQFLGEFPPHEIDELVTLFERYTTFDERFVSPRCAG